MKNLTKLLIAILTILVFTVQGQDYLLNLNIGIDKHFCKTIFINNDTVHYLEINGIEESTTPVNGLYGIHFYNDKPDELLLLSFQIDTIIGMVDSISDNEIYYRDDNRLLHSIDINDVFCILFEKDISIPEIESFYDQFIFLQKQNYYNTLDLIKKDGTKINISKLVSLVNDTINIQIGVKKRKVLNTFALVQNLSAFIYKEPAGRLKEGGFNEFILTKEESLNEVVINRFNNRRISFRLAEKRGKIYLEQDKKTLAGIFFHDYIMKDVEIEEVKDIIAPPIIVEEEYKLPDSKVTFDLNAGFGYMLELDKLFNLPEEDEMYLNKLRKGFAFDLDLRMFIFKNFGIGVKYNQFNTSSKAKDVLSENITIKFLGGTLFGNLQVLESKVVFNIDLSLGLLTKKDHFVLNNQSYSLHGNTIGVYVSTGLEYFILKRVSVGFNLGLLGGNLEKNDINSTYNLNLDKPHSLSRFDGMFKIKAYL